MYRLFYEFAHRYDLHTPPDHYRHDHVFVIEQARLVANPCRLLDVGCGTGVLIEKARLAGIEATGIDVSPQMIRAAEARLGPGAVAVLRMQDLGERNRYHCITALSWTLNYCEGRDDLQAALRGFFRALRPGGRIVLQVAHAPHVDGTPMEDREHGPGGEPDDMVFRYRYTQLEGAELPMGVEYEYLCRSANEHVHEEHLLRVADAAVVAGCAREVGFEAVELYDSWRGEPFRSSPSPFLVGRKAV